MTMKIGMRRDVFFENERNRWERACLLLVAAERWVDRAHERVLKKTKAVVCFLENSVKEQMQAMHREG